MENIVLLIPSYHPDEELCRVIRGMTEAGFSRFVVIDDGNGEAYRAYFEKAASLPGVTVLSHPVNRGKGAGIRTGLAWVKEHLPDAATVITVDADGQHRPKDALVLARAAVETPEALILGSRDFTLPQVPPRSRFGNRLTSAVFRIFCHTVVGDTQTGLRAIPVSTIPQMLTISGDRYEYETNVLLKLNEFKIPLREVEIETVYIDNNSGSHFHPIRDSARIYALIFRHLFSRLGRFLRFALSSLVSTAVDMGIFFLLHLWLGGKLGAFTDAYCYAIARVFSSVLNFALNRSRVFRAGGEKPLKMLLRYYAVAIPQMLISAGALNLLTFLFGVRESIWVTLIKACVDVILFMISYRFQRDWVFGKKAKDR